jgi:hypothetical protein
MLEVENKMGNNINLAKYGFPKQLHCKFCKKLSNTNFDDFDVDCEDNLSFCCDFCLKYNCVGVTVLNSEEDAAEAFELAVVNLTKYYGSQWPVYAYLSVLIERVKINATIGEMERIAKEKKT